MRIERDSMPPPFEVIRLPQNGKCLIRLYEGFVREDGPENAARYAGEAYEKTCAWFDGIADEVCKNLPAWLSLAKADELRARELGARQARDDALAKTDYLLMPDYPITGDAQARMIAYRQALRDLPETDGWPKNIAWPKKPAVSSGGDEK